MSDLRQRALRLLAQRDHARAELRQKLAAHAESAEQLDALLDDLAGSHLLSDARYAEQRVGSRSRRYGNARLVQELKMKGVSADDAAAALAAVADELSRARGIWSRKFDTLPTDAAERAKQTRFLMNRGFSGATIRRLFCGGADDATELEEE